MRLLRRLETWFEERLSGHVRIGRLTIYGYNAMHVALTYRTRRWGYICFHPQVRCFGGWWPWYFYMSPDATPGMAYIAFGPGVDQRDKERAIQRRTGTDYARWYPNDYSFGSDGVSAAREGAN